MTLVNSVNLASIPDSGDRFFERVVPGIRAIPGDFESFAWAREPLAVLSGEILCSWAHHNVHYAVGVQGDSEPRELLLVHRDNYHYRFWSIPRVNDHAVIDLEGGLRSAFTHQPKEGGIPIGHVAFFDETSRVETAPLHSTHGPPVDTVIGNVLLASFSHVPEVSYVRGNAAFATWESMTAKMEVSMTPALLAEGEARALLWVKESPGQAEQLLSFEAGWQCMREDPASPIAAVFDQLRAAI